MQDDWRGGDKLFDHEVHLKTLNGRLVVAFAGGTQNHFQFRNTLRDLGVSYILLRDSTQRYYWHGVMGIGNREAVCEFLRFYAKRYHTVAVGISSGSYAALLYGQLVPLEEVIAISPLSGREVDDFAPEYHPQITDPNTDMADLRQFYQNGPRTQVRAYVSDGDGTEIDRQMAERIGVKDIIVIPGYAHKDLAVGMRDKGMFKELFCGVQS
jgi:hypothetical protein